MHISTPRSTVLPHLKKWRKRRKLPDRKAYTGSTPENPYSRCFWGTRKFRSRTRQPLPHGTTVLEPLRQQLNRGLGDSLLPNVAVWNRASLFWLNSTILAGSEKKTFPVVRPPFGTNVRETKKSFTAAVYFSRLPSGNYCPEIL